MLLIPSGFFFLSAFLRLHCTILGAGLRDIVDLVIGLGLQKVVSVV